MEFALYPRAPTVHVNDRIQHVVRAFLARRDADEKTHHVYRRHSA